MTRELRPIRVPQPGISPFDVIKHTDPDGTEWWSARELGREFGYTTWQRIEGMLERARVSCQVQGQDPADHFEVFSSAAKNSRGIGRPLADHSQGLGRPWSDVRLTRFGCYMTSINGDVRKPQVAAAQGYFVTATRMHELQAAAPVALLPWSRRFREFLPHCAQVSRARPGDWTVISASIALLLSLEDELERHLLPTRDGDLPDGSIGACWSHHRRELGLAPSGKGARLHLPARDYDVRIAVYGVEERGEFDGWLLNEYVPEKLPNYLGRKESFRFAGPLPPASVADATSRAWSGRSARLAPGVRIPLRQVGGFAPVGTMVPRLGHDQPSLFD